MQFAEQIKGAERKIAAIKAAIGEHITSLPDNPRLTRISERCFTISNKDLGTDWSPEYHDFRRQYEFLASEIERKEIGSAIPFLLEISEKGYVYGATKQRVSFHPDVRKYIEELIHQ